MLSEAQILRYNRQIILPAVGGKGQRQLLSASAAIVGPGEMAAAAALYLSAAGVGRLTLVGVDAPAEFETLNPDCQVLAARLPLTAAAAAELAGHHDVVVAAGSAHETDRQLNAACVSTRTPLLWGDVHGHTGRFAVLATGPEVPCYECLRAGMERAAAPLRSALTGVVAAFIGATQAAEVLKLMLKMDVCGAGRLFTYDGLAAVMRQTAVVKDPHCAVCGGPASRSAAEG